MLNLDIENTITNYLTRKGSKGVPERSNPWIRFYLVESLQITNQFRWSQDVEFKSHRTPSKTDTKNLIFIQFL